MKVAVVTASSGTDSPILKPKFEAEWIDFYAFTDGRACCPKPWRQKHLPCFSNDPKFHHRRNAKIPKILPELLIPDYDYYIWQDSTHQLEADPSLLIERLQNETNPIYTVFRHTMRSCSYAELKLVLETGLDYPKKISCQNSLYFHQGFPKNYGLYELPVFAKKRCRESLDFSLAWFEQICCFSSRDQISFPFIVWKTGAKIDVIEGHSVFSNPWFKRAQEHACVRKIPRSWIYYKWLGLTRRVKRYLTK